MELFTREELEIINQTFEYISDIKPKENEFWNKVKEALKNE